MMLNVCSCSVVAVSFFVYTVVVIIIVLFMLVVLLDFSLAFLVSNSCYYFVVL